MSPHAITPSTATPRQIAYLKSLALRTGSTFSPPRTRRQASFEIERLKGLRNTPGRRVEVQRPDDPGEQPYATAVRPHEVSGFGSQATWRTATAVVPSVASQRRRVGELTELARYEVRGIQRVLYGQRIDGRVRVTDRPASGAGRSHLVDRSLELDGYSALKALVADYMRQAQELGDIPMASSVLARQFQADGAEASA